MPLRPFNLRNSLRILALAGIPFLISAAPERQETISPPTVRYGIDVLRDGNFALLRGKQVGLITNHTAVDSKGLSTADILQKAPGVKLVALFSPEHGIRGQKEHGQVINDGIDSKTRLPVYSLYGDVKRPTPVMLNGIDVLVYDIQDVGARFYTYITTMGLAMEAAAQRGISFVVLDRPNPIGGNVTEGVSLAAYIRHFTAYYSIPARYGLTPGELAFWYKEKAGLKLPLDVIPVQGWTRGMLWSETKRPFIPPSPNIRTPETALLYAGIGMFEATNVSVGRGTPLPFFQIGAPWMKGAEVAQRLQASNPAGVRVSSTTFEPTADLYAKQVCSGIRFEVVDPQAVRSVDLFLQTVFILRDLHARDIQIRWDEMIRMVGSNDFEKTYKAGKPVTELLERTRDNAQAFEKERQSILLY
jgi:uncharacterized protein YbbC (DUF1343 family)